MQLPVLGWIGVSSRLLSSVILTTANFTISRQFLLKRRFLQSITGRLDPNSGDLVEKKFISRSGGLPRWVWTTARFSLQLFKLYFSASTASKLQEVLNSLNSLFDFNYITSFLFLGILKMFCIPYQSRNLDQLRYPYPTLFTLSSVTRHEYLST